MATRNGAMVLGLRETLGRIAPGQLADLVLVRREAASTLALVASESALGSAWRTGDCRCGHG
jgi:imidazolonepropionase-like amidohydrolase